MEIALTPSGALILTGPSGQHFTVPSSPIGLTVIKRVLQAQAEAREADWRFGSPANPTQALIDEWLRHDAENKRLAEIERLRSLGFNNITLEI